jgi:hypothetical protein
VLQLKAVRMKPSNHHSKECAMTSITENLETQVGQRWEYRVVIFNTENSPEEHFKHLDPNELNSLGAEGWELVSTDPLAGDQRFGLPRTTRIALWFKRPVRS